MGMHASVLGIGGDIGGSIRVPAAFNGVREKEILCDCMLDVLLPEMLT